MKNKNLKDPSFSEKWKSTRLRFKKDMTFPFTRISQHFKF